jgi:hypothetical protein
LVTLARPRNFIFANQFARESFLANYHRQFSPIGSSPRLQNNKTTYGGRQIVLVRERGLEPPQPCGHYHLKVACIPISPLARKTLCCGFNHTNNRYKTQATNQHNLAIMYSVMYNNVAYKNSWRLSSVGRAEA